MDTKLKGCLFLNNWDMVFRNVKSRDSFYETNLFFSINRKVFLLILKSIYFLRYIWCEM